MLRSRRYRNRRLGDFLKELDLTEGRATGIPTIQKKLRENGSPKATIGTDDSRSYFLIDIPARKDFVQDADKIRESDIERIKLNVSKMCPRYVHERIRLIGNLSTESSRRNCCSGHAEWYRPGFF